MAYVKLLAAVVCTLFVSSASAQNITAPRNGTLPNITTPTLPPAMNTSAPLNGTLPNITTPTLPPVLNASIVNTTSPVNATVSIATLAVYQAVKARGLGLLSAFAAGDIVGVANYVAPDVQLVLPNTSAPITRQNVTTLLPPFLARINGSNATVSASPSDLFFYAIDSTNVLTVYEITAGGLGNVYISGFWQLINSTTSPNGTAWSVAFASMTPAPNGTYVPQAFPVFAATPNITLNATVNSTTTLLNTSLPAIASIGEAVINASTGLQGALNNATLSLADVTSQYVARGFQLVLPQRRSPIALNLTDPRVLTLFDALRALNTTGTTSGQQVVSYKQLNSEAAILLTSVSGVPVIGDAYLVQLWQYLNATTGTNTTTGVNTTALVNSTSIPLRKTWQLTFTSVTIAPPSTAGAPLSPPTPAPTTAAPLVPSAPAPQTSAPAPSTAPNPTSAPATPNAPTASPTTAAPTGSPTDTPSPSSSDTPSPSPSDTPSATTSSPTPTSA